MRVFYILFPPSGVWNEGCSYQSEEKQKKHMQLKNTGTQNLPQKSKKLTEKVLTNI